MQARSWTFVPSPMRIAPDVAAKHGAVPDVRARSDHDVTDDGRVVGDERVLGDLGRFALIRLDDRHRCDSTRREARGVPGRCRLLAGDSRRRVVELALERVLERTPDHDLDEPRGSDRRSAAKWTISLRSVRPVQWPALLGPRRAPWRASRRGSRGDGAEASFATASRAARRSLFSSSVTSSPSFSAGVNGRSEYLKPKT